ncbi:ATP-dependent helicase [Phytohalomonas tamaricis]|uniref:ATP-dependent helicase n=1 Tax=Phytohalomonas tamaricis TaxID=2081032 RepID=UPI0021D4356E|nr:ATP-dependent helicase [Phytohalomonas tamaricis]
MTAHSISVPLTQEQQAVVHHDGGHARVAAVAGAGKTSTLVARVLHLLANGVAPERILVLMFNRAAREDFTAKLLARAPQGQRLPQVRTFHSIGHRLTGTLTRWGRLAPRRLLEADWQRERLLKQAIYQVIGDDRAVLDAAFEPDRLEAFGNFCDLVKSELATPERLLETLDFGADTRYFAAAYHQVETLLEMQGVMTYADQLYRPLRCLERETDTRARVEGFLDHVIVDEYQDINEVQLRLLAILAGTRAAVMAVGDANQCIYEWRGARPDAMLERFTRMFGAPHDYPLSYTFRHGHAVALLANHAIRANRKRPDQIALAAPSNPVTQLDAGTGTSYLVKALHDWQHQGRRFDEAAVLMRSWALTVSVQLHFLRQGIPFRLGRDDRFVFKLPLVQALAGYLELARHGSKLTDPGHLLLLFSHPASFVTRERLERLCLHLAENQRWPDKSSPLLEGLKPIQSRNLKKRWELLCELPRLVGWAPAQLLEHVVDTLDAEKLLRRAAARREKGEEDIRLLDVLIEQAGELADDPEAFIALLKNPVETRQDGVLITTVHSAKGLEWPFVALWGLNEEDFPLYSRDAPLSDDLLEEERRLFYVGVTRARERLVMLNEGGQRRPSRFLTESAWQDCVRVAKALYTGPSDSPQSDQAPLEVTSPELVGRYLSAIDHVLPLLQKPHASPKLSAGMEMANEWQVGEWVHHAVFGQGRIEVVEGAGERCVLDVRFRQAGRRRLIAARAPLKRLTTRKENLL